MKSIVATAILSLALAVGLNRAVVEDWLTGPWRF